MNAQPAGAAAIRLADDIEAAAFADLYAAAPPALRDRLGLRIERCADATLLMAPGLPATMFNRGIGLGNLHRASDVDLQQLCARYAAAGVGNWWLHISPIAAADGLAGLAAARGFTPAPRRSWVKLLRPATPMPAVDTRLQVAPTPDAQATGTAAAIAQAFEMPPFIVDWLAALQRRRRWRMYSISDGSTVVGGACLFVDAGTGWLGMGAVLPSHRRRGGQQAALARRIADAALLGCTQVVSETGEPIAGEPNPSLANLLRSGFVSVGSRLNVASPPA